MQWPGRISANKFEINLYASERSATTIFIFISENGAYEFSLAAAVESDVDETRTGNINLRNSCDRCDRSLHDCGNLARILASCFCQLERDRSRVIAMVTILGALEGDGLGGSSLNLPTGKGSSYSSLNIG